MLGTQGDPQEQPHTQHTTKPELCPKAHTSVQHKCLFICPSVYWVSCEMLTVFMEALLMSRDLAAIFKKYNINALGRGTCYKS